MTIIAACVMQVVQVVLSVRLGNFYFENHIRS
jgi:hypothetical protein